MKAKRGMLVFLILGLGLVGPGVAAAAQAQTSLEGFETGDLSRFPWVTGGQAPWAITPISHSGAYAVQAGKVGDSGRSWLQISFTLQSAGEISFWYKVSSEEGHDFLLLFVDGEVRGRWSGETDWTEANFPLTAGTHMIRWEYIKDGSDKEGKDTSYLDDIRVPTGAVFVSSQPQARSNLLGSLGHTDSSSGNYTLGYQFTPLQDITIVAFRSYFGTKISLWDAGTGALIASAAAETPGEVWTEIPISSQVLRAGQTYVVGAFTAGKAYYWVEGPGMLNSTVGAVRIGDGAYIEGDARPTRAYSDDMFLVDFVYLLAGVGRAVEEGFESGDFSQLPWKTGGQAPWTVTSAARTGSYGAQAGKIGHSQATWLEVTMTVPQDGELMFWYRVSSESGCDILRFSVDGKVLGEWSGEVAWTKASFPVAAGPRTFRWEYAKDGSVATGSDTAWLDDIVFPGPRPTAAPTPTAPRDMVLIPAGSFRMGDSFNEGDSDERPVHTVTVSAFYMDKYEVTKALWDEVASWAQANGYDIGPSDGSGKAPNHPVWDVSWHEAVKWANARSEQEGLTPCYTVGGAVYRRGESAPDCTWTANGYRLPTEAEWEKAARGGCEGGRFPWCDTDTIQHARANYASSSNYSYDTSPTRGYHPTYKTGSEPYTSPVGSFAPNGYGLYDMAGNVGEWCWDWYDFGYYSSSPGSDPRGPASGWGRVIRGGGWINYADACRAANRSNIGPGYDGDDLGFRLVRTAP